MEPVGKDTTQIRNAHSPKLQERGQFPRKYSWTSKSQLHSTLQRQRLTQVLCVAACRLPFNCWNCAMTHWIAGWSDRVDFRWRLCSDWMTTGGGKRVWEGEKD